MVAATARAEPPSVTHVTHALRAAGAELLCDWSISLAERSGAAIY